MKEAEMKEETRVKIDQYGAEIDHLIDEQEYGKLKLLLEKMKQYGEANSEVKTDASMNYYLGTGYESYATHLARSGKKHTDSEVIDLRRWSMFYFRKGLSYYDSNIHTDPRLKLRILTNYANGLDSVGRVLEALSIYREVLSIDNNFSIARANYGKALRFLANIVNDEGHHRELHCYAYQAIKNAISTKDLDMHEPAIAVFKKEINAYESSPYIKILEAPIVNKQYELGDSEDEKAYRRWCLNHHLFLNPLNEVIELDSSFAHDPLTITAYTEEVYKSDSVSGNAAEPPRWFAMLNQLKEEYIYARFLFYEGSERFGKVHFADKNVQLLLASFDHTNYSIRVEQLKSSFRILYSLFDQICFFVNDFWQLGLPERRADARHICKSNQYPNDNVALNSLYWVLCEFFEKYGEEEQASEKDLTDLRNALEHKYVKVHEFDWERKLQLESDSFYHVSEEDLKKYTLRLLQISREALIYLVYAIGIDERNKKSSEVSVPLFISNYPDELKR